MMPDLSRVREFLEDKLADLPVGTVEVEEVVSVTVIGKGLSDKQRREVYATEYDLMERFPYLLFDFRLGNIEGEGNDRIRQP